MRILTAAVWLAAATYSAEASSILVIADTRDVSAPSVLTIQDDRELLASPSVQTLGPPVASAAGDAEVNERIPPLPTVIRAGIEGQAFTRAFAPGDTGGVEAAESTPAANSSASPGTGTSPRAAEAPADAIDPTVTTAAPPRPRALPAPAPKAEPTVRPQ